MGSTITDTMPSMAEAEVVAGVAARTAAPDDFTKFVHDLREVGEAALEGDRFDRLWSALRRSLRSELMRRGLWNCPPAFIGVIGYFRWTEPETEDDALDELTADCYSFVFLERIQALTAQLQRKKTLDGLVFRSIRNFLYERQRQVDPIGARVYGMTRDAIELLIDDGEAVTEPPGVGIGNHTWLRFGEGGVMPASSAADLPALIAAWADPLLPELIVARGKRRRATAGALAARIMTLRENGLSRLRFHQIVDSLRDAVRYRWGALLRTSEVPVADEASELERTVSRVQAHGFEAREEFTTLIRAVERGISTLEVDEAGREYLGRLWAFARAVATEAMPWPASQRYSRAAVAKSLSIPRNRMATLCATLERLVDKCRSDS